ncbi:cdc42 effector protein 5 [Aplochiton taeniatus]
MPLHKSTRGPRLDPTMISAPLGDFRHTMHIGRGGDAFGDTSFLSSHGPSPANSDPETDGNPATMDSETVLNSNEETDSLGSLQNNDLQHSESVSSFTLDLDLGPSILGDVLGVMDGMGLDSEWTDTEDVFSPNSSAATVKVSQVKATSEEDSTYMQNELNDKLVGVEGNLLGNKEDGRRMEGNSMKPKGPRPKVRFSDKREEIIRQASEEEGQGFEFHDDDDDDELECGSPTVEKCEKGGNILCEDGAQATNHKADSPPSPASSHSSDYEGLTPLDRRKVDNCHSETDSDEDGGDSGRGYTFEDEFDDEIGL